MLVAIYGAGSWGTALSWLLAKNGVDVLLWGRSSEVAGWIEGHHANFRYFPDLTLPGNVRATSDLGLTRGADVKVLALPSSTVREVLEQLPPLDGLIVIASKGFGQNGELISDLVCSMSPTAIPVALSGPNLANEIIEGIPTAAVAASPDEDSAKRVQKLFSSESFRVYLSTDIRGVELAGALKNVLAIAAGMSDGLGFGDNTKGALLARGLNEIARLGCSRGARLETFMGLAGVGDLFATANSKLSRNYRVGFALGRGNSLEKAIEDVGQIAEGVPTALLADHMARAKGLELPLVSSVSAIIQGRLDPRSAVEQLMTRNARAERWE
ncbi:MAG: NAD(P)H-dependent glycerol-3-phosphate dehydrogenase [Fimbriimonadaceae bacterium]